MAEDIEKLKYVLGYDFKDRSLLRAALTHRSYAAENGLAYDNQRLEFLGDAVLEIVLTEYLFAECRSSSEGDMTKMRSALAREETLAQAARRFHLGDYLLLGHGEQEAGGGDRDSTLADLFEAILGAWYLDAGLAPVRDFVLKIIREDFPDPRALLRTLNPKGTLQEFSQRRFGETPVYCVVESSGPEHDPLYKVEVKLREFSAVGSAKSHKGAESEAARVLLGILSQKGLLD